MEKLVLEGTVKNDLKFETTIDGKKNLLTVYKSGMHVGKEEPLEELKNYIGKKIKIKVQQYTDNEAWGASIVK